MKHIQKTVEENSPIAKDIDVTTDEDMPIDIRLKAKDKQGDKLNYKITLYPKNGRIVGSGLDIKYFPNSEFVGNDFFCYIVTDGTFVSNEAKVSIRVIDTQNIHIKEPYSVIKIDSKNFKRKIFLDSNANNLYLVLSNSSKNYTNIKVSNSIVQKEDRVNRLVDNKLNKEIVEPKEIIEFNRDVLSHLSINANENNISRELNNYTLSVGDRRSFYLNVTGSISTEATLRGVSIADTKYGTKKINIWVTDKNYGIYCKAFPYCISQERIDNLLNVVLKSGYNNDIYDWVTNIFGEEWNSDAHKLYRNLIQSDNTINLLLTDLNPKFALADTSSASVIGSRGIEVKPQRTLRVRLHFPSTPLLPSTNTSDAPSNAKFGLNRYKDSNGRLGGFFWAKDLFFKSEFKGSNESVIIYLYVTIFSKSSDYWQKRLYSVIAHELQHIISFYQKSIINGAYPKQ